jgi:hypothetical protein
MVMVPTAMHSSTPWPLAGETVLTGSTADTLRQAVCRLDPIVVDRVACEDQPSLAKAVSQLVEIVMKLRSPTAGWPADVDLTPEALVPYVSEELWELLENLEPWAASLGPNPGSTI